MYYLISSFSVEFNFKFYFNSLSIRLVQFALSSSNGGFYMENIILFTHIKSFCYYFNLLWGFLRENIGCFTHHRHSVYNKEQK